MTALLREWSRRLASGNHHAIRSMYSKNFYVLLPGGKLINDEDSLIKYYDLTSGRPDFVKIKMDRGVRPHCKGSYMIRDSFGVHYSDFVMIRDDSGKIYLHVERENDFLKYEKWNQNDRITFRDFSLDGSGKFNHPVP